MSESYNPFRMWGAWLGAVLFGLFSLSICMIVPICALINNVLKFHPDSIYGYVFSGIVPLAILGFLIGWGVHSLVRRLT